MYFVLRGAGPYTAYDDIHRFRPTRLYQSREINKPGRMIVIIDDNDVIDGLIDETDHTNPAQLRSSMALHCLTDPSATHTAADRLFEGRVFDRSITIQDGNTSLRLELLDRLGTMAETTVERSSTAPFYADFSIRGEYFQATNITMTPLKATHATYGFWFYPALSETQAWCPVSGAYATVYTTSSGAAIAAAATTITTNTSNHRRMKQRGIIKIVDAGAGDEYVYYDGYGLNAGSTAYEFRNCIRGCLGSAIPANHTAAALELRQFVPARLRISDGDWSLDYDTAIKNTRITPHPEDGYFEFSGATEPTNVKGTYKYANENDAAGHDGGTAFWTLALAIQTILERDPPLGPNLSTALPTLAIELPDIVIPTTDIYGGDALSTVLALIDERGLTGHVYDASYPNTHPRIGIWEEHNNTYTLVKVSTIAQDNDSAIVWPGFTSVNYRYTMDNTYTAVVVVFTDTGTGARTSRTVYLTDTHDTGNYDSVLDADAYDKFRGYENDFGRVNVIERSSMSAGEATALAESVLRQGLVLPDQRVYEVDQFPDITTFRDVNLGDTIHMPDGYYGLLTRYDFRLEHGIMHATLYLSDTLGGVY